MKTVDRLTKPLPHGIFTIAVAVLSALSLFGIDTRVMERHGTARKRFKVTGLAGPFLAEVFSDPLILIACLLNAALFGFGLALAVRAMRRGETGSFLRLVLLILVMLNYLALFSKMLFFC